MLFSSSLKLFSVLLITLQLGNAHVVDTWSLGHKQVLANLTNGVYPSPYVAHYIGNTRNTIEVIIVGVSLCPYAVPNLEMLNNSLNLICHLSHPNTPDMTA